MSLINDALKRAKAAQRPTATAVKVDFRPGSEATPAFRQNSRALMFAVLGLTFMVGFLVVRLAGRNSTSVVAANTSAPLAAPQIQAPPTSDVSAAPARAVASSATLIAPSSPKSPVLSRTEPPALPAVANAESRVTNTTQVEAAPPKPAPKLQAIVFSPSRPSAMINGRTVHVGDKFADGKVIGIDQESVTVIAAGQTNVLTLAQ